MIDNYTIIDNSYQFFAASVVLANLQVFFLFSYKLVKFRLKLVKLEEEVTLEDNTYTSYYFNSIQILMSFSAEFRKSFLNFL